MPILSTETMLHGRVSLALHTLRARETGPALLLLHALYGSSEDWDGARLDAWPGPVHALDFSGHGASDWLPGGGYAPEVFVAEADCAIARLADGGRDVHLAGAGVGAYVALLLGGARPEAVRSCLLLPGAGLEGGGMLPEEVDRFSSEAWAASLAAPGRRKGEPPPDPLVNRCERDVRPLYYAEEFARAAPPLHVAGMDALPPWLETARATAGVHAAPSDLGDALRQIAG